MENPDDVIKNSTKEQQKWLKKEKVIAY